MKKKLSVLLLSAVLCVTAIPVTGMAAEFSDGSAVETLGEDVSEAPEESSGQEEASLDVSDDAEILDYEDESDELSIGDIEQAYAGSSSDDFTDSADDFSDGEVPKNGNFTLSHEGIIQEGAICPKKTSVVLTEKWENALVNLVEKGGSVLDIASLSIPADQISDVVMLFINRHPEYYWLSFESCDVENGIAVTLYEDVKPFMGKSRSTVFGSSSLEEATKKALAVVKPEMSDLEKALVLHDYIALNTEYDYQGYLNGNLPNSVFTIEGTLVEGKAVCQGYALAYQYLLNKVGIESKYVASSAMNHGWNLVKIFGRWYHVDVTWDDPVWDQLGQVKHQYFLLSDAGIMGLKHYSWEVWDNGTETAPAAVSEVYNTYFWRNIDTGIWYYKEKMYYMEISSTTVGQIKCQSIYDSSATVLATVDMKWPYVGMPNYYWGNSSKTILYNGQFYYSGPDALYRINLDGSGNTKIADVRYTNQYVYGFAYSNGAFWIALHDSPNISTAESPMKITLGVEPTATPKPKPTATPKPKPTATPKPKPTATPKPKPTAKPKPKPTATPKPKPTATPKPKPTATPKPKPTAKPKPKPTATPKPSSNSTVITKNTYKNYKKSTLNIKKTIKKIESNAFEDLSLLYVYFEGSAPQMGANMFKNQALTAYYPINDPTWTAAKLKDYGGIWITWSAWDPTTKKIYGADLKKYGDLSLKYTTVTYTGKPQKMKVYVRDKSYPGESDYLLMEDIDYKVTWKNNTNAGTATVTVTGLEPYFRGTLTKTFKILQANNSITASNVKKTQSTKAQTFSLGAAKGGAKLSYKSNNKNVTVNSSGKVTIAANYTGESAITITAAATKNYKAAQKTVTLTVNPSGTSITKCTNIKTKKADIQWKKNGSATGYEVQYSTNKTFKSGVKTKSITNASTIKYTAAGLTSQKTYYVRVRAYKTVGKKKLYSSWSGIKTVKITK
ncbi:fibronectin type III domain-containing protein [Blautia luti]|uniref:transglutaminase domain-containing protein n=1 Tax=Blautia luti TaxID=89014 RepID=UPI001D00489A|nr:transglutaminase domain-containing protein [Blautia luti]MCB5474402.1 fibronectin type III domain-containing protein [Blautia luti]